MLKVKFRQLKRKDFPAVRALALKGWLFAYSHLPAVELTKLVSKIYSDKRLQISLSKVRKGSDFFIVAIRSRKIIGYCHAGAKGKRGELFQLYIEPKLIGKGLGKALLLKGEIFLRKKGCSKIFTFVNRHNKIGVKFYLRNGYVHKPKRDKADEFEPKALWHIEKKIE